MSGSPVVCFVTLVLSQYRVPFHARVRDILSAEGVDYRLIYSDPIGDDAAKGDTARLDWAERVPVSQLQLAGQTLYWQSALSETAQADLTIASQENKLLLNYWLQLRYLLFGRRMGFFGHGRSPAVGKYPRLGGALKRFLCKKVYWWFAYTPEVADLVSGYGFPRERISINYNSIDTVTLLGELDSITEAEITDFLGAFGIGSRRVGLYLGALYGDKRIDFLIEAARAVRRLVPDFELLIVGAGSHAYLAENAARDFDFIHYAGPKFGRDKAVALKASRACLLPGAVGLTILDSFVAACPLVTTSCTGHGPEIAYLADGENGVWVEDADSLEAYRDAVVRVMTDDAYWHGLKDGARKSARLYSIENMAQHFSDGVMKALGKPKSNA